MNKHPILDVIPSQIFIILLKLAIMLVFFGASSVEAIYINKVKIIVGG